MLKIEWAPIWNVPLHRRLEVLSAGALMFSLLFGEFITLWWMVFFVIKGNTLVRTLAFLYLLFIYKDRFTGNCGGRGQGWKWFRDLGIWKHYCNYFPLKLVKTAEISPDRNYVFALFPHGVLTSGAFGHFNTNASIWKDLFPGIRSKLVTLNFHFHIPFFREVVMSWGMSSVSAESLNYLLQMPNNKDHPVNRDGYTSNAVMIVVGGAQEAINSRPGNYQLVLKRRKGFVRMALRNGTPLVPVFSFGEVDIFDQPPNHEGTFLRRYQQWVKRVTGMAPVCFIGRGLLQYSFGMIPRRRPITTVVGAPIEFERNENPTYDDVDELHQRFIKELVKIFETHKHKYIENADSVQLKIE